MLLSHRSYYRDRLQSRRRFELGNASLVSLDEKISRRRQNQIIDDLAPLFRLNDNRGDEVSGRPDRPISPGIKKSWQNWPLVGALTNSDAN
jgi:hypothetical protein